MLNIDFEKVYYLVDWDFLLAVIGRKGFNNQGEIELDTRMHLSYESLYPLAVSEPRGEEFQAQESLRQGVSLSNFLFFPLSDCHWCSEHIIDKAPSTNFLKDVKVGSRSQ